VHTVRHLRDLAAAAIAAAALVASIAVPAAAAEPSSGHAAPQVCPVGPPSIGLTVQWITREPYYLVMRPNVVVQNCKGVIRTLSIKVEAFNNGRPINSSIGRQSTQASKYGNKKMTVRWNYFLAAYHGENPSLGVGPVLGIGVIPFNQTNAGSKQVGFLMDPSCTSQVNGLPVDSSGVVFRVSVYPRGANGAILKNVPAAVQQFACLQPV
jgi:hypothetical protein